MLSNNNAAATTKKKKGKKNKKNAKPGMDSLLNKHGKSITKGQKIRFTLVKGPKTNQTESADPINSNAPTECFPMIAKFSESVTKPDFSQPPWNTARLYQQDVPKAEIDSDEEEEEAKAVLANSKRRKRSRRNEPPKRQWILQEDMEFIQSMIERKKKRRQAAGGKAVAQTEKGKLSSRYEGAPEHNPSHFILLQTTKTATTTGNDDNGAASATIKVSLLPNPPNVINNFTQPAVRKTLTMNEAEQAIQDQRANMTRYMMHSNGPQAPSSTFSLAHAAATGKPISQSKSRLMGKLSKKSSAETNNDEQDEAADDIMGDVTFRERRGGGGARRELLTTLGDEGVTVDEDGVLGGANDEEFGGKRHFGRMKVAQGSNAAAQSGDAGGAGGGGQDNAAGAAAGGGADGAGAKGNAGMAIDDGFYQRDVKAEYEELDYDVNEQFDDDDVDVGETEMIDTSGFAVDDDNDDDDEAEEEIANSEEGGINGLASMAGLKAMLAKARGDSTPGGTPPDGPDGGAGGPGGAGATNGDGKASEEPKKNARDVLNQQMMETDDPILKLLEAGSKKPNKNGGANNPNSNNPNKANAASNNKPNAASPAAAAAPTTTNEVDADGLRVITLEAVRKEIWLHHGSIATKRLMKLFTVGKRSSKDRQRIFREIIRELCSMKEDPVHGRMLVLKQHYSSMG